MFWSCDTLADASTPVKILTVYRAFSNADFDKAFPEFYRIFVMSLDPNVKSDPFTITPRWDVSAVGSVEVLFNKTETDLPVIHSIHTLRSSFESRYKRVLSWFFPEAETHLMSQGFGKASAI